MQQDDAEDVVVPTVCRGVQAAERLTWALEFARHGLPPDAIPAARKDIQNILRWGYGIERSISAATALHAHRKLRTAFGRLSAHANSARGARLWGAWRLPNPGGQVLSWDPNTGNFTRSKAIAIASLAQHLVNLVGALLVVTPVRRCPARACQHLFAEWRRRQIYCSPRCRSREAVARFRAIRGPKLRKKVAASI
jgi:plasmid stabilization system protein ParE